MGRIWWHCAVPKMKTVCVTGASGYIASWIVKFLLQRGYTVKASVRDLSQFFFFFFFVEWWWWLLHSGLWVFDVIFAYWNTLILQFMNVVEIFLFFALIRDSKAKRKFENFVGIICLGFKWLLWDYEYFSVNDDNCVVYHW